MPCSSKNEPSFLIPSLSFLKLSPRHALGRGPVPLLSAFDFVGGASAAMLMLFLLLAISFFCFSARALRLARGASLSFGYSACGLTLRAAQQNGRSPHCVRMSPKESKPRKGDPEAGRRCFASAPCAAQKAGGRGGRTSLSCLPDWRLPCRQPFGLFPRLPSAARCPQRGLEKHYKSERHASLRSLKVKNKIEGALRPLFFMMIL